MKTCTQCHQVKPLTAFNKYSSAKDGHQSACKMCIRERQRLAYEKQPPRERSESRKRYQQTHMEEMKTWRLQYYKEHREKFRLKGARNYHENRDQLVKVARKARLQERTNAIKYLGGACQHCQITDIRVLTFDHIIPLKKPNRTTKEYGRGLMREIVKGIPNIQLLCANCHQIKTSKDVGVCI